MDFKDYYATLGVGKSATEKEIKQAYRKLARKHHPDVNPGDKQAETRFKEMNEAYEVLGDPPKRKKYDELGANWRLYEQAQQQGGGAGGPDAGWNAHFGGANAGGYRTVTPEEFQEMFGEQDPFSDFFQTFFGDQAAGRRPRQTRAARRRPGRDVEYEVTLSLDEAFHGAMRRLALKEDGHARTVDVRIPAGVKDGSRVRVAGEGGAGSDGAASGDLYLRVRLTPHPQYERREEHLYVKVAVPISTAVLGGEVDVQTLDGRTLRLRVPPATQSGQIFRFKGHGMPVAGKAGVTGDLYATADIQVPRTLTPEQRTHFEELAKLESSS